MARIDDFSDLFPFAHIDLPGCPQPLWQQHILQSGRKFCEKSRVWREDLDSLDLTEDEKEYTLVTEVDSVTYASRIESILEVRWNTEDGVTNGDKGRLVNWRDYSFNPNTNVLTFVTAPPDDVTSGLDVKVVLVPHLSATDMNDWVLNIYAETILAGAMWTLKRMLKKEWSDPEGAMIARGEWRNGIGKAKADIARQYRDGSRGIYE